VTLWKEGSSELRGMRMGGDDKRLEEEEEEEHSGERKGEGVIEIDIEGGSKRQKMNIMGT